MEESEADLDPRAILKEIGASESLATPAPAEPAAAAADPPLRVAPAPRPRRLRSRWVRFRHPLAALTLAFVGLLWLGAGLASLNAAALAGGGAALVLAVLVGFQALLR